MKRLIAIYLVAMIGILMYIFIRDADVAGAREYTAPPSEGSTESPYDEWELTKNSDGTYTEYKWFGKEGGGWVRGSTYSGSVVAEAETITDESALELGDTGNVAEGLEGSTEATRALDAEFEEMIRTGQPYTSATEAAVGDDVIDTAVSEGALPGESSVAAGFSSIAGGAGAVVVGVALGAGIDYVFGKPEGIEAIEELFSSEHGSSERTRNNFKFDSGWKLGNEPFECKNLYSNPNTEFTWSGAPDTSEPCIAVRTEGIEQEELEVLGGEHPEKWHLVGSPSSFEFAGYSANEGRSSLPGCYGAAWWDCAVWNVPSTETWAEQNYLNIDKVFSPMGFPAEGLSSASKAKTHEGYVHTDPKLPTPVKPAPSTVTKPITKVTTIKVTKLPEIEKEKELGIPLHPHIPSIEPNEPFEKYKEHLEREGYHHITNNVLPDTDIDPKTGPGDVSDVAPSPGTEAPLSSSVRVDTNPADAPNPETHTPIGAPTEPGFHLPTLHLLCTTMPFGVPCWLIKQMEAFSGTGSAPVWHIGEIKFGSHSIGGANVHLSVIEPLMEKIRPWMVIFGTIGIVLMFYKIFTGKNIGGGENPQGQVPEPWETAGETSDNDQLDRWNE